MGIPPTQWGLFDLAAHPPSSFYKGRICILGDAAHVRRFPCGGRRRDIPSSAANLSKGQHSSPRCGSRVRDRGLRNSLSFVGRRTCRGCVPSRGRLCDIRRCPPREGPVARRKQPRSCRQYASSLVTSRFLSTLRTPLEPGRVSSQASALLLPRIRVSR